MRSLVLPILLATVLLAGCTGVQGTLGATTANNATGATGAVIPKDVYSGTFSFAPSGPPGDPTAPTAGTTAKFPVPAGYQKLSINVTWTISTPAFAGSAVGVSLFDPSNGAKAQCNGPAPGDQTPPKVCTKETGGEPPAGDWKVVYDGKGSASAKVVVTAW